jgi:hypothetical protein
VYCLKVHPTEVAYPLRPELIESAYALYATSQQPRYLRTAQGVLETLLKYNKAACGFASVRNVTSGLRASVMTVISRWLANRDNAIRCCTCRDISKYVVGTAGDLEDSMESFFLSETAKYLFLIFSNATALLDFFVFTTEGHLFPVLPDHADITTEPLKYDHHSHTAHGTPRPTRNAQPPRPGKCSAMDAKFGLNSCPAPQGARPRSCRGGLPAVDHEAANDGFDGAIYSDCERICAPVDIGSLRDAVHFLYSL